MKVHKERCKDTLKKVNIAKSKAFLISAAVGILPTIQSLGDMIPQLHSLLAHVPPALMAVLGPGAISMVLKLQKEDMGSLVAKLDKL